MIHTDTGDGTRPVEVVVVAFGEPGLLERALDGLGGQFAVTVVDNSSDPRAAAVARRHRARYLDPGANVGFAAAVNRALAERRPGHHVLLLNPDAQIDPANIRRLAASLEADPEAACAAPRQRAPGTERPERVHWPFPSPARALLDAIGLGRFPTRRGFVIGSILLLRAEALEDVGFFDERFFLYAEETDWQLRAVRRGWTTCYVTEASAVHVGAGTGGDPRRRERRFHASYEQFIRKWYGAAGWQWCRACQVAGAAARAALRAGEDRALAARRLRLYLERRHPARLDGGAPMRVVHVVCTDAFAGVERYVVSVAGELARRGCDVTVVGGSPARVPPDLSTMGVRWYPGASPLAAAARLWSLGHVDVVHAHMTKAELAAALGRPRNGGRLVVTRHFARRRGRSPLARLAGRGAARLVDAQLAISDFVAGRVEGTSVVSRPGVAPRCGGHDEDGCNLTVLMVQRLEPEKQTELGLEAFAQSGLAAEGWTLQVAGEGVMASALEAHARRLGIVPSCRFLGPRADVDDLYAHAAIFLAPSPDEPFGLSVVEAMAHGLPVVAARSGGHLETVGRDPGAALFEPGDASDAARLLKALAGDPPGRTAYGARLQTLQRAKLSLERQAAEIYELYAGLADHRSRR